MVKVNGTPSFLRHRWSHISLCLYYSGLWISHQPLLQGIQIPLHFHIPFQEKQSRGGKCYTITWNLILNTQELLTLVSVQPPPSESLPVFIVNCRAAECWSFTHGGGERGEGSGGVKRVGRTVLHVSYKFGTLPSTQWTLRSRASSRE